MITEKTYRSYLIDFKDKLFGVLCLYEDKVPTLDKHLYKIVHVELAGMKYAVEDLPHEIWYAETMFCLRGLYMMLDKDFSNHHLYKSILFGLMSLIDKQIDQMGEE